MFCKSCGQEIDGDSKYCSFCGAKQSGVHKPPMTEFILTEQPKIQEIEALSVIPQQLASTSALESRPQFIPQSEHLIPNSQGSPPNNLLDEIHSVDILVRRPKSISISIFLQVAIIIHSLTTIVLSMLGNTMTGGQVVFLLVFTIWRALLTNSIFFLRKRSARNIYCVLALLRIAVIVFYFTIVKSVVLFERIENFSIVAIEISTVFLLFSNSARRWFNAKTEDVV